MPYDQIRLYKTGEGIVAEADAKYYALHQNNWTGLVNRENLHGHLTSLLGSLNPMEITLKKEDILTPMDQQEIWAAGVTYFRSREARMDESRESGGASFYDKIYDAERPELFFKATPARTSATGDPVYIRRDSHWNVPEPELTLFISSSGTIEGYTIGNDMSSRDIEGANPLYLPQAKAYTRSAALGPCLLVQSTPLHPDTTISLSISRDNRKAFENSIEISQIKRTFEDLVKYLFLECEFPDGVLLMTGTGIIPGDDFTLKAGDQVDITIKNIGTLSNVVGYNPRSNVR